MLWEKTLTFSKLGVFRIPTLHWWPWKWCLTCYNNFYFDYTSYFTTRNNRDLRIDRLKKKKRKKKRVVKRYQEQRWCSSASGGFRNLSGLSGRHHVWLMSHRKSQKEKMLAKLVVWPMLWLVWGLFKCEHVTFAVCLHQQVCRTYLFHF